MHLEDCRLVVKEENKCGVTLELFNSSQQSETGNFKPSIKGLAHWLIVSTMAFDSRGPQFKS